jgi:hypothetical protein
MYISLHVKYPLFLPEFSETLIFSTDLKKKKSDSVKLHLVGAQLFHADGKTDRRIDMTKLIVAFRNFANALQTINGNLSVH